MSLSISDHFRRILISGIGLTVTSSSSASSESPSSICLKNLVQKCLRLHVESHVTVNHQQHPADSELCDLHRYSPISQSQISMSWALGAFFNLLIMVAKLSLPFCEGHAEEDEKSGLDCCYTKIQS